MLSLCSIATQLLVQLTVCCRGRAISEDRAAQRRLNSLLPTLLSLLFFATGAVAHTGRTRQPQGRALHRVAGRALPCSLG